MKRENGEVGASVRSEQELDMSELENVSGGAVGYASAIASRDIAVLQPIKVVFKPNLGSIIGGVARRC